MPVRSIYSVTIIVGIALVGLLLNLFSQDNKGNITNYADKSGEFKRQQSVFRNWIKDEPDAEFAPEKDRYHLYISYACPWGTPDSGLRLM